jgi:hypothetical protein
MGALASQLGSVTVSAVPDEKSAEAGGSQNAVTNCGVGVAEADLDSQATAALTARQARDLLMDLDDAGARNTFILHDRDALFHEGFDAVLPEPDSASSRPGSESRA